MVDHRLRGANLGSNLGFGFIGFSTFFIENMVFVYETWAGNTQKLSIIYLEVVSDLETASKSFRTQFRTQIRSQKVILGPKPVFNFLEDLKFEFWFKTHLLSPKFEDPSCRICSYGP